MDHKELGRRLLQRMIKDLEHVGQVERAPMFEGRLMTMFMAPTGKPPSVKAKAAKKPSQGKNSRREKAQQDPKEETEAKEETDAEA